MKTFSSKAVFGIWSAALLFLFLPPPPPPFTREDQSPLRPQLLLGLVGDNETEAA